MVAITNLTTGIVTVGENEFVIPASGTIDVPDVRYEALKNEFLALVGAGQISISSIETPSFIVKKTRTEISGPAVTYTPTQVLGGIIHRVVAGGPVIDVLPTASDLVAAIPGAEVGTCFELAISASGGTTLLRAVGTGIEFIDDWAMAGNVMNIYPGNINHILFWVTDIGTPTIKAKVLSLGGFMDSDFVINNAVHGGYNNSGAWLNVTRGLEVHAPGFPSPFPQLQFEERHRIKSVSAYSGVVNVQLTASDLLGGLISIVCAGDDVNPPDHIDSFPNPADLVAAIPGCEVGSYVDFDICNDGSTGNGWTMYYNFAQPVGVTLVPDGVLINVGMRCSFRALITNVTPGDETYTVYMLSKSDRYRTDEMSISEGLIPVGTGWNTGAEGISTLTKKGQMGYIGSYSNNGGGLTRIYSQDHNIPDGASIVIYKCGEPSYNGTWTITVVDANHFDITAPFVSEPAPWNCGFYWWLPVFTNAGNISYSAANILGGFILRDPNGADRIDTLPDATSLVNLMGMGKIPGLMCEFTIQNIADAAEKITLAAGAGLTLMPVPGAVLEILQGQTRKFMIVITNADIGSEAALVFGMY